ncbi:MAG: hypothetical protein CK424_08780 [Legionella sp.]|nr:MAG: hypothetical protein CK424_08780 [Legionella sp.]
MNFGRKYGRVLISLVLLFTIHTAHAEEVTEPKPVLPLAEKHANWVFSGSVSNETGETYDYFLQVKRNDDKVHAFVSLVDAQSKAVIFMQNAQVQLKEDEAVDHWAIGDIFIRYNTINSSWVFGFKTTNQMGFNFKVDMLNQADQDPKMQNLHQGVKMTIVQTGQVNGHMRLKENDASQFVSGPHAWFRQIVMTALPSELSELHGLLCRFNDGSGLYSMKWVDSEMTKGTFSGLYSAEGTSTAISQFIHIDHLTSGPWRVRVTYPKLQFELSDVLQDQSIVLGFIDQKEKPGFCVISKEGLG